MLLTITNRNDATADYLLPILADRGIDYLRLDTDTLIAHSQISYRLGNPTLTFDDRTIQPCDIADVWYRRPEALNGSTLGESPEAKYILDEWTTVIENFLAHVPRHCWMNHPTVNAQASNKLQQLTAASSIGLQTPDSLLTQDPAALTQFAADLDFQLIAKPLATGRVKRTDGNDSLIYTNKVAKSDLERLDDLLVCPVLFQQYIPKVSDVRVTVVDNDWHALELLATGVDGTQRCDIRRNNMADVEYRPIRIPDATRRLAQQLIDRYRLRFAALDFVIDEGGTWYFLEINPNGQWAWLDLDGKANIAESFVASFSATKGAS